MIDDLVSIITPAYNCAAFLPHTASSILDQTYSNWEWITVDDCSSDDTASLMANLCKQHARVKYIRNEKNLGPAQTRNVAVRHAQGRFLAFLDADDFWLPQKLSVQTDLLRNDSAVFCFSQYRRVDTQGKHPGRLIEVPERMDYETLLKHNVIATLTVMVDRKKTGAIQLVDQGYDDYILWLELLRNGGNACGIQQDLARYRVVGNSSISSRRWRSAFWVWNIYRNVERLSLPKSVWYFANHHIRSAIKHSQR